MNDDLKKLGALVGNSETLAALEAEIVRRDKAQKAAAEQKQSGQSADDNFDSTPFGRKIMDLGFFKT